MPKGPSARPRRPLLGTRSSRLETIASTLSLPIRAASEARPSPVRAAAGRVIRGPPGPTRQGEFRRRTASCAVWTRFGSISRSVAEREFSGFLLEPCTGPEPRRRYTEYGKAIRATPPRRFAGALERAPGRPGDEAAAAAGVENDIDDLASHRTHARQRAWSVRCAGRPSHQNIAIPRMSVRRRRRMMSGPRARPDSVRR